MSRISFRSPLEQFGSSPVLRVWILPSGIKGNSSFPTFSAAHLASWSASWFPISKPVPQWAILCSSFLDDPLITEGAIPHIKVWHGTCPHRSTPTGLQPAAELKILLGGKHRGQPSLALDCGRRHLTNLIPCTLLSMQFHLHIP